MDKNTIIGKRFPVLNDGFVGLIDVMGDDQSIAQSARVSFTGTSTGAVKDDRRLIRYLMRHQHTSPFEMAELKFMIRTPIYVWRQWIRHRTASVNEYSSRYSPAITSCQTTAEDAWRLQATDNKQGSDGFLTDVLNCEKLTNEEIWLQQLAHTTYSHRIEFGIAREQARKDLPLSTYTEAFWKLNLRNLLHFLKLRMDSHAQKEIREYANIIGNEIVAKLFPATWEAFQDFEMKNLTLSRLEKELIQRLCKGYIVPATDLEFSEVLPECWPAEGKCSERDECLSKLKTLGLIE